LDLGCLSLIEKTVAGLSESSSMGAGFSSGPTSCSSVEVAATTVAESVLSGGLGGSWGWGRD